MRYKRVLLGVVVVSALALAGVASWAVVGPSRAAPPAQPPDASRITVPYAGRLNDTQGEPVADGAYDFSFGLYAEETGGKALWQETQKGVPVAGGSFSVQLGSVATIPEGALGEDGAWLALAVRGPVEVEFTNLAPRQPVRAATATGSDVSAAAGMTCPHNHFGETWSGSRNWSQGAFIVANTGSGPSVWAKNTGGGNAVRGDGYGTNAIGVYGEADGADGVVGSTTAYNKSGVFGNHTSASYFGYGVYGTSVYGRGVMGEDGGSNPDDSYAVYGRGDMYTDDDLTVQDDLTVVGFATFNGGKSGYVVDVARNDDTVSLEAGDVVVISGAGPAVVGEIPVIKVRRAMAAGTSAVVGVVDQHYVPTRKVAAASEADAKAESAVESADVAPGEYLTVVTLGAYRAIKVDASYGAIAPGDVLVASPNAGYAMRAASPAPGSIVGKALGALEAGSGVIPVIITLQ